jgi:hypothetical protein
MFKRNKVSISLKHSYHKLTNVSLGNPAQKYIASLSFREEKAFDKEFELAKSWMHSCIHSHTDCQSSKISELPTRYIELSPPNKPPSARLRHSNGEYGAYVALSYCWGAPQPFRTTKSTLDAYMAELPYQSLPQSILDSFDVTRRLGLRNIWIDSLCVVQDDPKDLSREIGKMFAIYQNARVTISAAKAENCNEGFLSQPPPTLAVRVRVSDTEMGEMLLSEVDVDDVSKNKNLPNEIHPINTRAWTLQEELLATRLLIFGHNTIAWKCQIPINAHSDWCNTAGFLEYSLKDIIDARHPEALSGRKENEPMDLSDQRTLKRLMWGYIVEHYMKRQLSEESDRLPAISAVAEFFARYLGEGRGEYVAGLWRRTLIIDLLWENHDEIPSSRSKGSGAPSWSWASVTCAVVDHFIILNGYSAEFSLCAEVLRCEAVLVNELAPYGAVRSGELVVNGWLKRLWVGPGEMRRGKRSERVGLYGKADCEDMIKGTMVKCDTSDDLKIRNSVEDIGNEPEFIAAWALTLGYQPYEDAVDETKNTAAYGLILLEVRSAAEGTYRRVAYFRATSLETDEFWWEQCEKVTVTII